MLMLIGVFVYFAASAEAKRNEHSARDENLAQQFREIHFTSDVVERAATESLPRVYADWQIKSALHWISRRAGERFSVVKNGIVIGVASVADLQFAVASGKGSLPVEKVLGA